MVKITRTDNGINFNLRDYIILVERYCPNDQSYSNVKMVDACMKLDIPMTSSVNEILSAMINKVADKYIQEYISEKKAEYDELMLFNRNMDNFISKLEDNLKNNIYKENTKITDNLILVDLLKVEGDVDTDWGMIYMYRKDFTDTELGILYKTKHLGITRHIYGKFEESYVDVKKILELSVEDRRSLIINTLNIALEDIRLAASNAANATTLNLDDKYKWLSENLKLHVSSCPLEKID